MISKYSIRYSERLSIILLSISLGDEKLYSIFSYLSNRYPAFLHHQISEMQRPRRENETIENSAYRNTFVVTHKHRRFRIISPFQPPFLQHIYPSFLLFSFCHGEHGSGSVKISRCFLFNNETPASTRLAEARVARKLTASHGVVSKCMVAFQSINWPALVRISIPVRTREAHR